MKYIKHAFETRNYFYIIPWIVKLIAFVATILTGNIWACLWILAAFFWSLRCYAGEYIMVESLTNLIHNLEERLKEESQEQEKEPN